VKADGGRPGSGTTIFAMPTVGGQAPDPGSSSTSTTGVPEVLAERLHSYRLNSRLYYIFERQEWRH
jgi:hypothetical protein